MKKRYLLLISIIIMGGLAFTLINLSKGDIRPEVKRAIDNNVEVFATSEILKGSWEESVTAITLDDLGLSSINELSNAEKEYLNKAIYER